MSQAGVWEQSSTGVAAQLEQRPEPRPPSMLYTGGSFTVQTPGPNDGLLTQTLSGAPAPAC